MSHEITSTDNMAYVGEKPWHGLGTELPEGCSIEQMQVAAGLNWTIETRPMSYLDANDIATDAPRKAMLRMDTNELLDVVGPEYIPAQPAEVLEFFRDYLAAGELALSTAGSLKGGRYIWGQADLKDGFTLAGGDEVKGKLLVANPNRYGKGLIVKFVAERVVCWNTLTAALGEGGRQVTIAHNRKMDEEGRRHALRRIGLATTSLLDFKAEAEALSKRQLTEAEVLETLAETFRVPVTDSGELTRQSRTINRVRDFFEGAGMGADLVSARGTAWGLLNAVTQYVDHEYGHTQDARMEHAWFGGGEVMKRRAQTKLRELADIA